LGFRLDIHIAENDYLAAIELLPSAHKHKDISSSQIYRWEYAAYLAMFKHLITSQDINKLEDYWAHLSKKQKQSDAILLAYARTLAESNNAELLTSLLLPIFKKEPSAEFLSGVKLLPRINCAPLLEQVHLHLKKQPEEIKWLSMLAHLAAADGDWRMAEQTFAKVVPLTKDKTDIIGYARVLETLGQHQKANQQYQSLI
jgi:HemY protein